MHPFVLRFVTAYSTYMPCRIDSVRERWNCMHGMHTTTPRIGPAKSRPRERAHVSCPTCGRRRRALRLVLTTAISALRAELKPLDRSVLIEKFESDLAGFDAEELSDMRPSPLSYADLFDVAAAYDDTHPSQDLDNFNEPMRLEEIVGR